MAGLTERQRAVLRSLDFEPTCAVRVGTPLVPCQSTATWRVKCRGCSGLLLVCLEHKEMLLRVGAPRCRVCNKTGKQLLEVFEFAPLSGGVKS